jgi:hypothetical protein
MKKRYVAICAALLSFAVFLVVTLWGSTFGIEGGTSRALLPGSTAPINVRITNPHFYPIVVSQLTVRIASITPIHKGATCKASNFTVTQAHDFKVRLAANSTVAMKNISSATDGWPSLHLTANQAELDEGCQGATIKLAYSANGSWWTK